MTRKNVSRTPSAAGIGTVALPSGDRVPALGQGTWGMGERSVRRADEIAALRLGLDLGMTLIDTAEMYGEGGAEEVVGEAIAGRRDDVFVVSKLYPHHATEQGTVTACERSLKRLRTDRIDLYLLHWRDSTPLDETVRGFERLIAAEKIRYWGVSNFDVPDMNDLIAVPNGSHVAVNQVLYNLSRRGVETNLLPWSRKREIPLMAYSPVEQGRLLNTPVLARIAERCRASPAQVAIAWLLQQPDVIVIPKAGRLQHVRENCAAAKLQLDEKDLVELDRAYPRPQGSPPLEML